MIRDSSDGRARNSYWPMPFREVLPDHRHQRRPPPRRPCSTTTSTGTKVPALPPDTLYFHARYRQALPAPAERRSTTSSSTSRAAATTSARCSSVVQAEAGWFGEGDDFFWVDGEKEPSIEGTGTRGLLQRRLGPARRRRPLHGVTVAEGTGLGSRMTAYRWHLAIRSRSRSRSRFEIEHWAGPSTPTARSSPPSASAPT